MKSLPEQLIVLSCREDFSIFPDYFRGLFLIVEKPCKERPASLVQEGPIDLPQGNQGLFYCPTGAIHQT